MTFSEGDRVQIPLDPRPQDGDVWWADARVVSVYGDGGMAVVVEGVGRAYCPPGVARPRLVPVEEAA